MYCIPKGNDNKEADMETKQITENSNSIMCGRNEYGRSIRLRSVCSGSKDREQRSADVGETALVK